MPPDKNQQQSLRTRSCTIPNVIHNTTRIDSKLIIHNCKSRATSEALHAKYYLGYMTLKQKVYDHYIQLVNDKLRSLPKVLADLKESGSNETKSTAGDKHETSNGVTNNHSIE